MDRAVEDFYVPSIVRRVTGQPKVPFGFAAVSAACAVKHRMMQRWTRPCAGVCCVLAGGDV
jgi:hypothetical protein